VKYLFCSILFFWAGFSSYARNVSELLHKLETEKNDSIKIGLYKDVFYHYQYSQPDSAKYILEEGIAFCRKAGNEKGRAAFIALSGQLESALGRQDVARKRYNEALGIFEELNDPDGVASVYNGLGVCEGRQGNYLPATRHFMKALAEYERTSNTKGIINTYVKLGTVNDISGNIDKALEFHRKGLALSLKTPGDRNGAYFYNCIGVINCKKDRVDSGIIYFNKALLLADSLEQDEIKLLARMHLGNAYKELSQYSRALRYYNEALALSSPGTVPEHHSRILLNIAVIKGLTDHPAALKMLNESLAIANEIGQKPLRLEIMEEMIMQHKLSGDYKSAFLVLEQSKKLQDSIFDVEKDTEMANLIARHELERSNDRVHELEASQAKNALQRNIIITIAFGLGLSLIALSIFYRRVDRLNKSLVKSEAELQKTGAIKDRVFSIIGHDLRGPIANIPMVIELYENPNTTDEEKAYMRDLVVENSMASLDTLDKLLHWGKAQIKGTYIQQRSFNAARNLEHQLSLLKGLATNKSITIINNLPKDTSIYADEDHFNFVIRNLLSNAIKFSHNGSEIYVDADRYAERGFTVFSVKDSGIGIEPERMSKIFEAFGSSTLGTNNEGGTSIGLMLCKEFVVENGGRIWVQSQPGMGTTFFFSLKNA
jgi:signal transduction histidine kinase